MYLLSGLGVILALGSFLSIWAAKQEIERAKGIYRTKYKHIADNENIPSLTGAETYHQWGHFVDWLEPWLLVVMWIFLAVYVGRHCGSPF